MLFRSGVFGAAVFSILLMATHTLKAADVDLYEWQFSESNDPGDPNASSAQLIYGIPETDDIQVTGVCEGGDRERAIPTLTFGADVGSMSGGVATELRFSAESVEYTVKGRVQLGEYEEGLDGVVVPLEPSDPFWTLMADKAELSYAVPGSAAAKVSLKRGRENISKFLAACRKYAAQIAPAGKNAKP